MTASDLREQHIGVLALVLSGGTKVLIGKRKNAYKSGFWGFPGGRLKLKESLEECIKRELYEETLLKARKVSYIGAIREHQGTYDFIHFVYVCKSYRGSPICAEPDKCEGWVWAPLARLPKQILPAHKTAVRLFVTNTQLADF